MVTRGVWNILGAWLLSRLAGIAVVDTVVVDVVDVAVAAVGTDAWMY